jgi:hypothetical protein
MSSSENRRRPRMVPIRLSDEEFERVREKADRLSLSVPGYLRELALQQKVKSPRPPLVDREAGLEIARELRAIGNNVNQLARRANEGAVRVVELDAVQKELAEIWRRLNSKAPK